MTANTRGSSRINLGMALILLFGANSFPGIQKCYLQTGDSTFGVVNTTDPPMIENGTSDGKTVEYFIGRISHLLGLKDQISDTNRTIAYQVLFDPG